jgi:peptidoglycan hydrolase-like protein with peptidoglycan-binding domain
VRDALLRHLHAVHSKAKSPKSAGQKISEIQKALKVLGYKQQVVASNLDYLIQKGWVREEIRERSFTTKRGTTIPSEGRSYKISDTGIEKLEAASTYQRSEIAPAVNITNIRGVTVVGEGNVVNASFTDVAPVLNELRTSVLASPAIADEQKLDVAADIDALQSQLQKPAPNRNVVTELWKEVATALPTATGLVDLADKAAHLLRPLLS